MTISDILDRLEALGLVRREADPTDSRAKLVWITEAATPIVAEMRTIAAEVYDRALDGITPAERETLIRALLKIAENLESANEKRESAV